MMIKVPRFRLNRITSIQKKRHKTQTNSHLSDLIAKFMQLKMQKSSRKFKSSIIRNLNNYDDIDLNIVFFYKNKIAFKNICNVELDTSLCYICNHIGETCNKYFSCNANNCLDRNHYSKDSSYCSNIIKRAYLRINQYEVIFKK